MSCNFQASHCRLTLYIYIYMWMIHLIVYTCVYNIRTSATICVKIHIQHIIYIYIYIIIIMRCTIICAHVWQKQIEVHLIHFISSPCWSTMHGKDHTTNREREREAAIVPQFTFCGSRWNTVAALKEQRNQLWFNTETKCTAHDQA